MATLFSTPTESSSIPSAADFEPDEQWKTRLQVDIENNLRSMVDEAKHNLLDTLKKAPVNAIERERLSDEHLATMTSIRNLAEEQFRIALERERRERRWAAGQTLDWEWSESMIQEQRDILDKIERERKDKAALSSCSSRLQPTAGTSESHASGHTLEHPTWTLQEPMEIVHEAGYFPRLEPRDNHVLPRDTGKGRAGSVLESYKPPSTLDITDRDFDCSKPPLIIDELEVHRSARSATDTQDRESPWRRASFSSRPVPPEFWLPPTPEEGAQMSRTFIIARRGSAASTTSSYWAPSVLNIPSSTEPHDLTTSATERDRISALEQEWSAIYRARDRSRTMSYTYTEAGASASTFQRLDERYPPPSSSSSVAPSPRSVVPTAGYSHSSDSLSSTIPIEYSRPSDSSYPQVPPSSASRPIPTKKMFSFHDDDFQSSSSPKDWDGLSRSPYETHYESSHSPQTPDEVPWGLQSSNIRTRPSSQDMRYGYYHVQPVHYDEDLDDSGWWEYGERKIRQREENFRRREEVVSLREQELKKREEYVKQEEEAKRKEEEPERGEDEAKWKEMPTKKTEEEDGIKEAAKRKEDEVSVKEEASRAKEEEIQRKEEELARREEELLRREAEATRRYDAQQKVQQTEFRNREEPTEPSRTMPPPRMSTRSFSSSTVNRSERNMSATSTPTNRGRSKSTSTSRSSTTWISSTRLTSSSLRSSTPKPQTPSAQKNSARQMSTSRSSSSIGPWPMPNHNELHDMSAASPPTDRGRTSTSRSNATWKSSSRLSSSSRPPSTHKPQTPSAQKSPSRQMSTSRSSSSTGPLLNPSRNELHMSAVNPPKNRGRSDSTSTSRSNTTWTSSTRLTSTAISQSSSTLKPQTPSSQKNSPRQMSTSRSFSSSTGPSLIPSCNDLYMSATSLPAHKSRSKSISASRSSTTWTSSTRPSSSSQQPSTSSKPQTQSPRHNDETAPGAMSTPIMESGGKEEEEDTKRKDDGIKWREMLARKEEEEARKEARAGNRLEDLRRENEEARRVAHDFPKLAEATRMEDEVRCKEDEAGLEEFRAMDAEIQKVEKLAQEKECNSLASYPSETMQPQAQSLLNTSISPSGATATEEEEPSQELPDSASDSLEDLTNELQGRSKYPTNCGGFGDIWKCDLVKPSGTVPVAVKTIRAFESDNEELMRKNGKRVRRELKVWGRLKHHSILPLWGVANDFGPHPAMICPWADNGALTSFLERQQDMLSAQDKFSLLNDIALGLQYLHNESVVHGDLTGSNVLIYGNGRACLADFGLSTIILEFIGTSYFTTSVWGNIRWAAMELYETPEDNVSLSTECDIYSFGSITLQVLSCKVPYHNVKNEILVLGQVIKGKKPEPPNESQIAPGHWEFIQRCWSPRSSRPSVEEIVEFVGCEQALAS